MLISLLALGALILSACTGGQGVSNNWHGLAADAERAYVANGGLVYAVDLKTGTEVWHFPEKVDNKLSFFVTPVLTPDGQLLVGSTGPKHPFYSLNPATGKENWPEPFNKNRGAWLASPLIFNDKIYAPNTDGFVYIIDMKGEEAGDPIELGGALWSAPVTDGSLLYVTSLDHHFHVIDPTAGATAGKPIDLGGAAPSSPVIGSDGLYVGSFASTIEHIKFNGEHNVIATTGNWIWGSPILDGETLYYADLDGKVYSLDLATGNQNWDVDLVQADDKAIVAGLLEVGDQIYVATEEGTLIALDQDGKTVWEKNVGGEMYTTPILAGDEILVAPYKAEFVLVAYNADGNQAWAFTPDTGK
jgi:outer membrane protein assembly factor BamB